MNATAARTIHIMADSSSDNADNIDSNDRRIMNDSTMPLPARKQNTKPTTSAAAAAAAAKKIPRQQKQQQQPQKQPTKKSRFGLSEWNRLLRSSKDLAQLRGKSPHRKISRQEISRHCQLHDGWIALRGKVYNISPYVAYHPGGQSILKPVLGKDATAAFEKYHPWVNQDGYVH